MLSYRKNIIDKTHQLSNHCLQSFVATLQRDKETTNFGNYISWSHKCSILENEFELMLCGPIRPLHQPADP